MDPNENMDPVVLRLKIKRCLRDILDKLSYPIIIAEHIYSNDCFSEHDCDNVQAGKTTLDQARELMRILARKGDRAVILFMEALKNNEEDHIYEAILAKNVDEPCISPGAVTPTDSMAMELTEPKTMTLFLDWCVPLYIRSSPGSSTRLDDNMIRQFQEQCNIDKFPLVITKEEIIAAVKRCYPQAGVDDTNLLRNVSWIEAKHEVKPPVEEVEPPTTFDTRLPRSECSINGRIDPGDGFDEIDRVVSGATSGSTASASSHPDISGAMSASTASFHGHQDSSSATISSTASDDALDCFDVLLISAKLGADHREEIKSHIENDTRYQQQGFRVEIIDEACMLGADKLMDIDEAIAHSVVILVIVSEDFSKQHPEFDEESTTKITMALEDRFKGTKQKDKVMIFTLCVFETPAYWKHLPNFITNRTKLTFKPDDPNAFLTMLYTKILMKAAARKRRKSVIQKCKEELISSELENLQLDGSS